MRPRRVLSSLLALLLGVCGIGLVTGTATAYGAGLRDHLRSTS
ncbi:hypothetical protein [Actinoallomurus sp. NPDC050550]